MELKKIVKISCIIIIIFIILDQTSKILIDNLVTSDVKFIPNILTITKLENEGLAFGINKQNLGNAILVIVVLIFMIKYMIDQKENMTTKNVIFLSLILAGGISNLIDRIFRGAVFDFIQIGNFPVFNFADMSIVIGWILFVINFIFYSYKEVKEIVKEDKKKE